MTTSKFIKVLLIIFLMPAFGFAQHHQMIEAPPLSMPGNDIFGTIQEVVQKLENDPNTDWSKVDLEALRQHLLDMKAFTEEVKVVSQTPIENGLSIKISPETERASEALGRLFQMHPSMLKQEKGWEMQTTPDAEGFLIRVTTENEAEVEKLRGLGYIGILAEGAHHQAHHWMIATGKMHMK